VIIPFAAVTSAFALNFAMNREPAPNVPAAASRPAKQDDNVSKYSFDMSPRQLYRVEIKRFDKYEDAEASLMSIKNKRLNGFIIKEQGYLVAYGVYMNKSQADTAAKYLKRKGVQDSVNVMNISGFSMIYDDVDKNLIDLSKAADAVIMKIAEEKAALSLESLYGDKKIGGQSLEVIIENEAKLDKYLNYLSTVKSSEKTRYYKQGLEDLINEVLLDRLSAGGSYGYYDLQNSLLNQIEALSKFYNKLIA
jgi:hypothetical protein